MKKKRPNNYVTLITILFLMGVGLWRLHPLSLEVSVVLQAVSVTFLSFIIIYRKPRIKLLFKYEILLIFLSVIFSMIMAAIYHGQGLGTTFVESRFMYFYLVYFALAALNVPSVQVEKAIKYTAVFFGCMYFLQYLLYPLEVFYYPKVLVERSTLRFRVDGFELLIFLAAFSFYKILNKKINYYPLLILAVLVNLLSGSRYLLFITAIGIGLVGYKSKNVSIGLKIFAVIVFLLSLVFIIPSTYVQTITETSQKNLTQGSEYIRIPAALFYLFTYNTNIPTWLFGNGISDAHSTYGLQLAAIGDNFGFYLSDIGFIGEFVRFGIFYFLVVIVLLYRAIKHSYKIDQVLNAYLIGITIFYIISWPFGHAAGIILFSSVLYLINKKTHEKNLLALQNQPVENQIIIDTIK